MTSVLPILYAANFTLVTLVMLILGVRKGAWTDSLPGYLISIAFPVMGTIFAWGLPGKNKRIIAPNLDHIQIEQSQTRSLFLQQVDISRELQTISLDDAILMNPDDVRRKLLMDCLKGDAKQFVGVLKKALNQDDQETAHYAAAGMMELRRQQTIAIQETEIAMERQMSQSGFDTDPGLKSVRNLVTQLESAIMSDLYDSGYQLRFRHRLYYFLERIIKSGKASAQEFRLLIRTAIDMIEPNRVRQYFLPFKTQYPDDEYAWLLEMEFLYVTNNPKRLKSLLRELKGSQVVFSRDTLEIVRFWQGEQA